MRVAGESGLDLIEKFQAQARAQGRIGGHLDNFEGCKSHREAMQKVAIQLLQEGASVALIEQTTGLTLEQIADACAVT